MKKIIKISVVFVCVAVLFFNVSLNMKSSRGNIDLTKLITVNEADAECMSYDVASGKCVANTCVFAVGYTECDPYQ